jgi:hypothetical protein
VKTWSVCLLVSLCGASACVGSQDDENIDVTVGDEKADAVSHVTVNSGVTSTVSFNAPAGAVDLSVDCAPPANPDSVGMQFTVKGTGITELSSASKPIAGLWQWSGDVTAGAKKLELRGSSGSHSCTVRVRKATGSCTASTVSRQPETGHTHLFVGSNLTTADFPAAGNHWGAWAKWGTIYTRPVKRGFYLHNLEHGGLVLSYKCSSPTASAQCQEAAANLTALANSFGEVRVIVTPDPQQPTLYGIRGWRVGYQSDCFNEQRMTDFMGDHFRDGREDLDVDPPVAYDPTTTQVPCVDLMAAPDSCN